MYITPNTTLFVINCPRINYALVGTKYTHACNFTVSSGGRSSPTTHRSKCSTTISCDSFSISVHCNKHMKNSQIKKCGKTYWQFYRERKISRSTDCNEGKSWNDTQREIYSK